MRQICRTSPGCFVRACLLTVAMLVPATALAGPQSAPAARLSRAALIPIRGEISEITLDSIERRLQRVRAEQIPLVIFELDTPGGALGPTLDICSEIKKLRDAGVRTAAWIHDEAYSAGTIIALATDGLIMSDNASIGSCQPITVTAQGAAPIPEGLEAKVISPLRAELRDSARRNGYSLDLVMGLILPDTQVYWMENARTGERRFVSAAVRDELLSGATQPAPSAEAEPGRAAETAAGAWHDVKEAPGLGQVSQPIKDRHELLTLRTPEAAAFGWSLATVNSQDDLRAHFDITGPLVSMQQSTWETIVSWLASPVIRGLLLILVVLGAYTEFHTPGFGVAGITALIALVVYLGAPYLAGFTVTWEILAVLIGIALLCLEIFVIPGFGVPGIAGILLIVVGFIASYIPQEPGFGGPHIPELRGSYTYLIRGLWSLAMGTTGSLVGMVLLARYLPRLPIAGRLVSKNPSREEVVPEYIDETVARIGHLGLTESLLRPAGKARFGPALVDVVSEGEFIEKGVRVEVVDRQGSRVVVRRVD